MTKTIHPIESLESRTLFAFPVTMGSAFYDSASKVLAMPDGGVVVAGLFTTTADFDPTSGKRLLTAQEENADAFVARYSSSGALRWVRQFSSDAGEIDVEDEIDSPIAPERAGPFDLGVGLQPYQTGIYVTDLALDSSGNVIVAGAFRGSVNFQSGSGKRVLISGGEDSFINTFFMRLNASGGLSFVRQISSRFTNVPNALTLDANNNIHITGYFTRSANFNVTGGTRNLTTVGREDIFVAKYDPVGRLNWVSRAANEVAERTLRSTGNAIALDNAGNVFVTGAFAGETRFVTTSRLAATTLEAEDETDTFVARYSNSGALTWVRGFGGEGYEGGVALTLSPDGQSVYVGSYFQGTIDVNPGVPVQNVTETINEDGDENDRTDLLISNFVASSGALTWARPLVAGTGYETLGELVTDASGNLFATGGFSGLADFNPLAGRTILPSTLGVEEFEDANDGDRDFSYDFYLQKLAADGSLIFARNFGSASDDYGTSLSLDPSGRVFLAGQFRGTYFFPGTSKKLRPIGAQDAFVALFDANGQLV